jgi:hypothetical protein
MERWTIRGVEYANCNCAWGCPCQFNSPSTNGRCEAFAAGRIDEGRFGAVPLDGLGFCMLLWWPGEIAEGNGRQQAIIDERANPAQREALRKILHGEDTAPGATHFFVFNSTMAEVLDPIYARFAALEIDVPARRARVSIPGLVESTGSPITNPHSGEEFRARIDLPNGFEYRLAEVGTGESRVTAGIELSLSGTYGQFNVLHMNQDGVIG